MYFIEHFRVIGNHIEQVHLRFRILLGSLTVHTISLFGRGGNILVGLHIFHIETDSSLYQQIFDWSEFQITTDKKVAAHCLVGNIQ